jgi:DNA-binding IclR family transcriptional regulator
MDETGPRSGSIQSVERAVAVLKLFGEAEPDLGVTELARRLKLHKSTVSRLLSTLEAGGFVQQDPRTGRYRLGLQLATLAGLALTQYDLREVARPLLTELAQSAGETTTLSVLDGDMAVNIDQVLAPHPVKHLGWIGRRLPVHCTAAGKPLLAHQPREALDRFLAQPLLRFTPRTITNPMLLRRELEAVRSQGYAIAEEEYEADLNAAGAAVRDHRGDVVASISISGPTFRLTSARFPELGAFVRHTAERISARLGHRQAGAAVMATARRVDTPGRSGQLPGRQAGTAGGAPAGRRPAVGLAGPAFGN